MPKLSLGFLLLGPSLWYGCWREAATASGRQVPATWREPVTGMDFVYIPPGRFTMGSPPGEPSRQDDEVEHEVEISRGFYLGRYEVTQEQWRKLQGNDPSQHKSCDRCPVETVSFTEIQDYIRHLDRIAAPGGRFRLPTEAEWEYACRAGTRTPFSTGATLTTRQANFDGRDAPGGDFLGAPAPVGSYPPNPWGLEDMHGNVWEWTEDWYGPYPSGPVKDPKAGRLYAERVWDARGGPWVYKLVIRGGSWYFDANSSRCALRYTHSPDDQGFSLGFRLVREVS